MDFGRNLPIPYLWVNLLICFFIQKSLYSNFQLREHSERISEKRTTESVPRNYGSSISMIATLIFGHLLRLGDGL